MKSETEILNEYDNFTRIKSCENMRNLLNKYDLKPSELARELPMAKADFSRMFNEDSTNPRRAGLIHVLKIKQYFKDNYNIDVSSDYILGFTDILENNVTKRRISKITGLSSDNIEHLENLSDSNKVLYNILIDVARDSEYEFNLKEIYELMSSTVIDVHSLEKANGYSKHTYSVHNELAYYNMDFLTDRLGRFLEIDFLHKNNDYKRAYNNFTIDEIIYTEIKQKYKDKDAKKICNEIRNTIDESGNLYANEIKDVLEKHGIKFENLIDFDYEE